MSRSHKLPVIKGHNRWFKRYSRRQIRARDHVALRKGCYDQTTISDRSNWSDWRKTRWGKKGRQWWRWFGK